MSCNAIASNLRDDINWDRFIIFFYIMEGEKVASDFLGLLLGVEEFFFVFSSIQRQWPINLCKG